MKLAGNGEYLTRAEKLAWFAVVLAVVAVVVNVAAMSSASPAPQPMELFACYEHGAESTEHGEITNDGAAVTLHDYNPSWPGGVNGRFGNLFIDGVQVAEIPASNTPYFAADGHVDSWLVCKFVPVGTPPSSNVTITVPPDQTATTTATTLNTTTLPVASSSSTVEVPPTSTVDTLPNVSVCDEQPDLCAPPTAVHGIDIVAPTSAPGPTLPPTGWHDYDGVLLLVASLCAAAGSALLIVRRRPAGES